MRMTDAPEKVEVVTSVQRRRTCARLVAGWQAAMERHDRTFVAGAARLIARVAAR